MGLIGGQAAMLKALWIGMLVFIPFGVFVVIAYLILKLPPIYGFLHARSSATFIILSLASAALTCLYFWTLNGVLVHRAEAIAQWHVFVRWIAVIAIGGAAAVIVSAVFCAVVLVIGLISISGKRLT